MTNDTAFFAFSTDEDLSYVLEFSGLVLTGRSFEVKIKDRASDTMRATLTNGAGLTISGSNVLEAVYAKAGMSSWPRGEYSADVVDVTGGGHSRIMAVRFVLNLPGRLVHGVRDRKAFINWSPNRAVVTATGAIGPAGPPGSKGDQGDPGTDGTDGTNGTNGWVPELAIVSDGAREVQQVTDWFGGTGSKPATGQYVGDSGFVSDAALGKDIRGPVGPGIGPSDFATQGQAEAGVVTDKAMSPLRTEQYVTKRFIRHAKDMYDYGAIGDGVADDTAAINAWLASAPTVVARAGTFVTGQINVPSTVKEIIAEGEARFIPKAGTFLATAFKNEWFKATAYVTGDSIQFMPTFENIADGLSADGLMYRAKRNNTNKVPGLTPDDWEVIAFDDFWLFAGHADLTLTGLAFNVPCLIHPHVRTVNTSGCTRVRTRDLKIPEGGGVALYMGNCKDVVHASPDIRKFAWQGIFAEGSLQENITIDSAHVSTSGTGTAHGITFSLGRRCYANACTVKGSRVFGMTVNETDQFVLDGIVTDTGHEAFNTISGKNGIIRGVAKWEDVLSTDFGISIDGTTGSGVYNVKIDAVVERSGVSALVFTGTVTDCVGTIVSRNCNQTATSGEAGILFTGSDCQRNTGYVSMIDQYSPHRMPYGIAEMDKGNGTPTNNTLFVQSVDGALVDVAKRAGSTTRIYGMPIKQTAQAVTAGSGTITTANSACDWTYDGVWVVIERLHVVITTNGTGSASVDVELPIPAVASAGMLTGKEIALSGKAVTGEILSTKVSIRNFDNSYPGANGAQIILSGRYKPAA